MNESQPKALWELTLWRVREFLREPEALFWVFAFPVLLTLALGLAFRNQGPEEVQVGVVETPGAPAVADALAHHPALRTRVLDSVQAAQELRTGGVAILVFPGEPVTIRYDTARAESQLARLAVNDALQEAAGRRDVAEIREQRVTDVGSRYIDFLVPGLLGMNIMGTGMWGVGFAVVKARSGKLLKRFVASPMRRSEYLASHMLARLVFLALEAGVLLAFARLVFGVPMRGSWATLSLVVLLGASTFSGLGLLVASRVRTIEAVSGLMNLVMVPMWILSGVFFSASNFPNAMQPLIRALPLTALNDALRAVMIDGASLGATLGMLAVVILWGLLSFGVALKVFRWQ